MISAVVLAYNDSEKLSKTLASLIWCDERIIIDDDSTEDILSIAKKYKASVFTHAVNNNFAQQRNIGLSMAKGDWIFFVDSDEIVPSKLAEEIKLVTKQTDCKGFTVRRLDSLWGKTLFHGEIGNISLLRLARKDSGKWTRPVHETWEVKGKLGRLSIPLMHYPHETVSQFLLEINQYSTINAQYLFAQKVHVPGWHLIAYPLGKFIKSYFICAGYLDGMPGFIVSMMMSFHSFLTRGKLYLLYDKQNNAT